MNATGTITMTMREVDRLKVIEAVTESRLLGQAWTLPLYASTMRRRDNAATRLIALLFKATESTFNYIEATHRKFSSIEPEALAWFSLHKHAAARRTTMLRSLVTTRHNRPRQSKLISLCF